MTLQEMLFIARAQLRDLSVKKFTDAELIAAANIGKCDLVSMMREAREDYFLTTTTSTVGVAVPPNPSTVTLPTDFLELKEILCVTPGYYDISFQASDRTRHEWRAALIDGGSLGNGTGLVFYDIYGNSTLAFSPGFDVELQVRIDYIQDVPDMYLPTDTIPAVPDTLHHYVPTFIVCSALRSIGDPRLARFEEFRKEQLEENRVAVQPRQIRDSKIVRGYMEDDEY